MQVIRLIASDVSDIKRWFPANLPAGYLFAPGIASFPVGEAVAVWLRIPYLRVELFLQGLVAWRRQQAGATGHKLPAGTGVALDPRHGPEIAMLGRIVMGERIPMPPRGHPRLPVIDPWSCNVIIPHLQLYTPAAILDISEGGARVGMGLLPLHEGCAVEIGLPWHSGTTHAMSLAWYRTQGGELRLGLQRRAKGRIHEEEWADLLVVAQREIDAKIPRP